MLARGAASVGKPEMPRYVVVDPGTSVGLTEMALHESADMIAFGSEYRTAPGSSSRASRRTNCCSAAARRSPSRLPGCGGTAVSVARVGVIDEGDAAARQTADSLAAALGATVVEHGRGRSACSSSAPGLRRLRAKSCSAPAATTRSRRPTTGAGPDPRHRGRLLRRGNGSGQAQSGGGASRAGRPGSRPRSSGRGRRAARAPPPTGTDSVSWPETMSASVCTAESVWRTSVAGPRGAVRCDSEAVPSTVSLTSFPEPLRVRPAVAEGEVLVGELRPFEDPQRGFASSRVHLRSPSRTARPESHGSRTVRRSSSSVRLKERAWLPARWRPRCGRASAGRRYRVSAPGGGPGWHDAAHATPSPPSGPLRQRRSPARHRVGLESGRGRPLRAEYGQEFTTEHKRELVGKSATSPRSCWKRWLGEEGRGVELMSELEQPSWSPSSSTGWRRWSAPAICSNG